MMLSQQLHLPTILKCLLLFVTPLLIEGFAPSLPSQNFLKNIEHIASSTSSRYTIISATGSSALYVASSATTEVEDYDLKISSCQEILTRAAETKAEDPEIVLDALLDLEKCMRKKRKTEGEGVAEDVLKNLTGDWRLIFTTGTVNTQERFKTKINYFPLKAVQSFDATTDPKAITNGIFLGNFAALKFFGDFDFDLKRSKLTFDFDKISVFGFDISLKKTGAAEIGAKTGLGSKSNVKNAEQGKSAFFNWISANENIATARGGGGGLALWKRADSEGN